MKKQRDRSGQGQQQQERGFENPGGHQGLPQGGDGDRQQGGGGQVHRGDKPGKRGGRQRDGGQGAH